MGSEMCIRDRLFLFLHTMGKPSGKHLLHRSIIIGSYYRLNAEFPIIAALWPSIFKDHHRAYRFISGNIGNIKGLHSADILQPEKEETYQFIEKLLSSVKENFSTNRVHLGMDEAVMLGLGNYLKENGYKKGSLIIREHCNRVVDICRKLELKPMIWSDMYITANSTGGYYDLPENTDCSKWEKPKKDLGLVYWDYYHDDTRTYEKMLDIHAQLSDNVIFAGGSWIWNGISPNYSKTYACTKAALSTCKKYNIKEVLCTAWMDNGAETPVDALLPGLVLFAHLDFHRDYDETILKQEFRNCTGGEFDDFMALDNFDSLFLNTKENLSLIHI